jgi:hypothetical protein
MPLSGDEFTFPTGLAVVRIATASGTGRPVLPVVDRWIAIKIRLCVHEENASMFTTQGSPQTVLRHFGGKL